MRQNNSLAGRIRRILAGGMMFGLASFCGGCGGGGGGGGGGGVPQPVNKAPDTKLEVTFNDDGTYSYFVTSTDEDGIVKRITVNGVYDNKTFCMVFDANAGGETRQTYQYNRLEAIAEDDKGKKDDTPYVTEWQTSKRSMNEAYSLIKGLLENNKSTYQSLNFDPNNRQSIFLDDKEIKVDFVIERLDGRYSFLIVGDMNDNAAEKRDDHFWLDNYSIFNLLLNRLPLGEIETRVNDFIDRGYESDF